MDNLNKLINLILIFICFAFNSTAIAKNRPTYTTTYKTEKFTAFVQDFTDSNFLRRNTHELKASVQTMAMIWAKNFSSKKEVIINIVPQLLLDTQPVEGCGVFLGDHNTILLPLNEINRKCKQPLNLEQYLVYVLAHEIQHVVQLAANTAKDGSGWTADGKVIDSYVSEPNEIEAYETMVHAFKAVYPSAQGYFTMGHSNSDITRRFEVPLDSNFSTHEDFPILFTHSNPNP